MEAIMRINISKLIIGTTVGIGLAAVSIGVIDSAAAGESAYIEAPQVLMNGYQTPCLDVDSYDDLRRKRAEQSKDT
jgi:hypothetical protein